jgi:beta-carotene 3-hydroxylase
MDILINILIFFSAFLLMEFVAWFAHKYIMHGFLWVLHEDHHNLPKGFIQKNDSFFIIFALPSMISILLGALLSISGLIFFGFGIAFYGFAYFLMHEVLIHKRYKPLYKLFFARNHSRYLKAMQKAHFMHHKHLSKDNGESFGMLIFSKKYFEMI